MPKITKKPNNKFKIKLDHTLDLKELNRLKVKLYHLPYEEKEKIIEKMVVLLGKNVIKQTKHIKSHIDTNTIKYIENLEEILNNYPLNIEQTIKDAQKHPALPFLKDYMNAVELFFNNRISNIDIGHLKKIEILGKILKNTIEKKSQLIYFIYDEKQPKELNTYKLISYKLLETYAPSEINIENIKLISEILYLKTKENILEEALKINASNFILNVAEKIYMKSKETKEKELDYLLQNLLKNIGINLKPKKETVKINTFLSNKIANA